jgi:hypothetical protein
MGILWTIIIGFVTGVVAKFLMLGPNEPSGFILTTILGHSRCLRGKISGADTRFVRTRRRRRLHRRGRGSDCGAGRMGNGCKEQRNLTTLSLRLEPR